MLRTTMTLFLFLTHLLGVVLVLLGCCVLAAATSPDDYMKVTPVFERKGGPQVSSLRLVDRPFMGAVAEYTTGTIREHWDRTERARTYVSVGRSHGFSGTTLEAYRELSVLSTASGQPAAEFVHVRVYWGVFVLAGLVVALPPLPFVLRVYRGAWRLVRRLAVRRFANRQGFDVTPMLAPARH